MRIVLTGALADFLRPRQYGSGWLSPSPTWTPKVVSPITPSVHSLASRAVTGIFDSLFDVTKTLPPHLLLSLIYRVAVLHLAARIVPVLRKASTGWDDGMETDVSAGFWDGKSLGEEPAVSKVESEGQRILTFAPEHANHNNRPVIPPGNTDRRIHPSSP